MSRDMHMYLEHFNKEENKWEAVQLFGQSHYEYYRKDGVKELPFMTGGWSVAMEILTDSYRCYPELKGNNVFYGGTNITKKAYDKMFANLSEGIKKHYDNLFEENGKFKTGYFGLGMINVANIVTYIAQYPELNDYESEEEDAKIDNPFKHIVERINMVADMLDIWDDDYANFRIIYWGDC